MTSITPSSAPPQRDMNQSAFASILTRLVSGCPQVIAAVFFDKEGETIDYHSYLDPYSTRLLAAHTGLVFGSAAYRMTWLGAGPLLSAEISTNTHDIIILPVGDEFYLTIVMCRGASGETADKLSQAVKELAEEAGL